ncbi:hypothetical protein ANCCAN_10518 [Ancylostoma caninum]|uniref:DDE Tnp4 domain-containing protein n=1 Tax=Ancylostoma caninum TaxID=29170 RepID=A0A368GKD4_ANCCA|nr:hypothetical protein ANCCAN_10518 [Ancylostoma caninum]
MNSNYEDGVITALRYLTSNTHQTVLSDCIGCSQKTISNAVAEFVTALNHPVITKKFINFKPSDALHCRGIARGFTRLCRLPNIIGAIDGCCTPLRRPDESGWWFYCRKGFTALNVLAIVDYRGKFLYVNAGYP